jgi:O-methyltransferase
MAQALLPLRKLLRRMGFDVVRYRPPEPPSWPLDFDDAMREVASRVAPFTMISPERLHEIRAAIHHVVRHRIEGAIVECGVWRGGSVMAAALALLETGAGDRELWLYDTFEGMTEPAAVDVSFEGESAHARWQQGVATGDGWCVADEDDVRRNLASTGYDMGRVRFVRGKVEETLPHHAPDAIACLRLDTDWYDSTKAELVHLFPRLAPGGLLIVDDYGHWQGSRRAVDEFLEENGLRLFLGRTDYSGRVAVKP